MINQSLINNELLIVEAEIFLRTTEEGGRKTPIKTGYRPNHFFDGFGYMGSINFENEWLYPGCHQKAQVCFIDVVELREKLVVGREWLIQEGSHVLGKGIITKLC